MNEMSMLRKILLLLIGVMSYLGVGAQNLTVQGVVLDEVDNSPIPGASVLVKGTTRGTITNFDGQFQISVAATDVLVFSFIGYQTQELPVAENMTIKLIADMQNLDDVVVIGYGTVKKNDLTGSVTAIKPDDMNKGLVTNAQDMMQGKIAGVSVVSNGGTPGGSATIRIRGGASLSASNDPLIVIDGLAMDNAGVQGLANPLSMVNPNDIESFTVLKDASATAIYGSRASNGVIVITTKKGSKSGKMSLTYNGNVSVSTVGETLEVMDGDEFRSFIKDLYGEDSDQAKALGTANTDWQDEIYRAAVGTDHNVTATGNLAGAPFRFSAGYTMQDGVIKTSEFRRVTLSANYAPSFFDDYLKVNANIKAMHAKNRYADGSVVGNALTFDPTQSVYCDEPEYVTSFGGYFQWTAANNFDDASWPLNYNTLAQANPVATLEMQNNRATSMSLIGNIELDYKFHGLEDLRFHVNGGMDLSTGEQKNDIDPRSASNNYYGWKGVDQTDKYNLLLTTYLQYAKEFESQNFDIMAGYEWQHFHRQGTNEGSGFYQQTNNDPNKAGKPYNPTYNEWANESFLVSFFGRANYTLLNRYMLTATFRADGSSKFNKDNRWGYFPSVALAWKIKEEAFLQDVDWMSDFKLRLGYGLTGQQEGIGEYSYYASYKENKEHAFYPILGEGSQGSTLSPNAYNDNLTWEKTTTYNAGLDLGILQGRFNASLDFYHRETTDLLQTVSVAAGSNFSNKVMSNVGSLENTGVEFSIGGKVIHTSDFMWDLNYNVTWNKNEITELSTVDRPGYYIGTGGISAGTGNTCQAHAVGHAANAFYVYQQVYDAQGNPIENMYVDRNGDGIISDNDRYFYYKPTADVLMGLSSKFTYKNFDLGFSLRASLGNYVFNDVESNNSNMSKSAVYANSGFFSNFVKRHTNKNFQGIGNYYLSDIYVQNASFLKCDNITLGYSFDSLFGSALKGRVYASMSNVFTITKYEGLDPEVSGGIDNNIYPRPMVSLVGLTLNF